MVLAVSACMPHAAQPIGHDFSRGAFSTFVLETTTLPDVEAVIGTPFKATTISGLANQHALVVLPGTPVALTMVSYFFAPYGAGPLPSAQTPTKSATLAFFQGRLVGYDVNSSIPGDDNLPIPEDRLGELHKGTTSRDDAIALLGAPNGQSIVFGNAITHGASTMTYNWAQVDGDMVRRKMLKVQFDTAGRFSTYTMLDNSFPLGSAPMPLPLPRVQPSPPPGGGEPLRPYADPGHT